MNKHDTFCNNSVHGHFVFLVLRGTAGDAEEGQKSHREAVELSTPSFNNRM